jgi:hypothetical protein
MRTSLSGDHSAAAYVQHSHRITNATFIAAARPLLLLLLLTTIGAPVRARAASATILGWNNLGMHCMDSDYSVFSVLPPYNTIESQLIVNGRLVTNGAGYTVTYQAVADPSGSFNSTAMGKGNFYTYAPALYGANLPPETGLLGWMMPGSGNTPQGMLFETTNRPAPIAAALVNWFRAEGIPISPYDDAHNKNPYPLMRMIASNSAHQPIATNDVVLPVSDEMDCRACHASGTQAAAQPAAGWLWDGLPERDYRLNILRLHDERQFAQHNGLYTAALAARGFTPEGLYRSVTALGKPVLCAACHASEALGAPSYGTIPALTASVHAFHAHVMDPVLNTTLDNSANRAACYRCHPGSTTRCLRGAMGGAVAADGSMEMQCQSCHGNMSQVGLAGRVGWFMEPNCQSCHTGTATHNNGQIRYTSAFTDGNFTVRVPVDNTFATKSNTPAPGISLFRFSAVHGGLQCEACHGSTHAEFPATHRNDNLRNIALQGHAGVMVECTACHATVPNSANGGPHGMHAIDQGWISGSDIVTKHADVLQALGGEAACAPCHGTDYRGTVLSRAQADRNFTVNFDGTAVAFQALRGQPVGCYNCHQGPGGDSANTSLAPTVANATASTSNDQPVNLPLQGTGANLTFRILGQPANGTVGLLNNVATYFPSPGFVGTETFTFAAYDGAKNSNRGTGTVTVAQGPFSVTAAAHVPPSYPARWPVAFNVVPSVVNHLAPVSSDWDFGDGTPHQSGADVTHAYDLPGNYTWQVVSTVAGVSVTSTGSIQVTTPVALAPQRSGNMLVLSWPVSTADVLLESSPTLGSAANWTWFSGAISLGPGQAAVPIATGADQFFRLRRPW